MLCVGVTERINPLQATAAVSVCNTKRHHRLAPSARVSVQFLCLCKSQCQAPLSLVRVLAVFASPCDTDVLMCVREPTAHYHNGMVNPAACRWCPTGRLSICHNRTVQHPTDALSHAISARSATSTGLLRTFAYGNLTRGAFWVVA